MPHVKSLENGLMYKTLWELKPIFHLLNNLFLRKLNTISILYVEYIKFNNLHKISKNPKPIKNPTLLMFLLSVKTLKSH